MTLFLKMWGKWIVVALVIAGLYAAVDHYRGRAATAEQTVKTVTAEKAAAEEREARLITERTVLIENQKAWAATAAKIDNLARVSATARAAEAATLSDIAAAKATAKEGIKNAPGADDRFDFSDAAYGFMRDRPEATGNAAGGGGANPR